MSAPTFTVSEKLAEVEREIGQRHKVYGRLVDRKMMTPAARDRLIAIMQAVADDYRRAVEKDPRGAGLLL